MKKLFLSHYSIYSDEIMMLAESLRLHGIIPWVDKDGGFIIADNSEDEARRAIRDDCFGLLLYATPDVFDRPFVRDIEMDEACKIHSADDRFMLFALPRNMSFEDLAESSKESYGIDMSQYHTYPLFEDEHIGDLFDKISSDILEKVLRSEYKHIQESGVLSLQISTRELMPQDKDDILCVNAINNRTINWEHLLNGLLTIKSQIAKTCGRPRIFINGSKHLTTAFMIGRVFSQFTISIRQKPDEVWSTDGMISSTIPFKVETQQIDTSSSCVFIEIASRYKKINAGTDAVMDTGISPHTRLSLTPKDGALDVDESICRSMAHQAYEEIDKLLAQHGSVSEIHLFAAAPQSFLIMLGREFKGMPPVQLYEWDGTRYNKSIKLDGNALISA